MKTKNKKYVCVECGKKGKDVSVRLFCMKCRTKLMAVQKV